MASPLNSHRNSRLNVIIVQTMFVLKFESSDAERTDKGKKISITSYFYHSLL